MSDVKMPQMGESIVEGTITKWLKKVGESVERDEALFEISTDKVDSEVPAPISGVVSEILILEGETVEIETVVARIAEGGAAPVAEKSAPARAAEKAAPVEAPAVGSNGSPAAAPPEAAAAPDAPAAPTPAAPPSEKVRSSPLVRRIARESGVELSQVPGSGQGGRISKKDLEAYLRRSEQPAAAASPSGVMQPTEALSVFRAAPETRFGDHYAEPLSVMRQKIAEHMVLTKRVSPHVSTVHQIDCTMIARLRAGAKERFLEQNGLKLTFMPFFLKATASALKAFPPVNASLDGENVVYHRDINLGMAVAIQGGLIVPVIKNADDLNVLGLQRAVNDLADRARSKRLKPDEIQHGTFSITNYGGYGSLFATPAINQPQVAILGMGAIHKAPVVINDAIAIRSIAYLTLSFDHRLIDGAIADQFLTHLRGVIENWEESIL